MMVIEDLLRGLGDLGDQLVGGRIQHVHPSERILSNNARFLRPWLQISLLPVDRPLFSVSHLSVELSSQTPLITF